MKKLCVSVLMICLFWCTSLCGDGSASGSQREFWIEVPVSAKQFPITKSTPGQGDVECGSLSDSPAWRIGQWRNEPEQSLCKEEVRSPGSTGGFCPGATWERASETMHVCYWKDERKIRMAVNAYRMRYGGRCVDCDEESRRHPGGYAIKLGWRGKDMPDFSTGKQYWLRNLKALKISTGFAPEDFKAMSSSADARPAIPGRKKSPQDPVGHAHVNLTFADIDPQTEKPKKTIVLGTVLWDSRAGWSEKRHTYVDCDFPVGQGRSAFTSVPITRFTYHIVDGSGRQTDLGSQDNALYSQPREFDWDVLPLMLDQLKVCLGSNTDLSNLKLIGAIFGIETRNSSVVVSSFVNPRIGLFLKDTPTGPGK